MSSASRPAAFLDRDGVLVQAPVVNGRPRPPSSVDEVVIPDGVPEACRQLRLAGLTLVVVTNQPDIARGVTSAESVEAINSEVGARLGIDHVEVCPHDDADGCACRKPKPGLLVSAAERLGLDLARSVMVGDRWRDVEAGRRAGVATVFIDRGYVERKPDAPDLVVPELHDAVPFVVELARNRVGLT